MGPKSNDLSPCKRKAEWDLTFRSTGRKAMGRGASRAAPRRGRPGDWEAGRGGKEPPLSLERKCGLPHGDFRLLSPRTGREHTSAVSSPQLVVT